MILGERSSALAPVWIPLLYETIVVLLTLHRIMRAAIGQAAGTIILALMRGSILYYMYVLLYYLETILFHPRLISFNLLVLYVRLRWSLQ